MPIGVFDSGVGGIGFVKELFQLNKNVDIIYFGDTFHMPYGSKSRQEISRYVNQIIEFLISKNVDLIVSACGTVSSLLPNLELTNNVIGIINSACLYSAKITKNKKIGILATPLSIKIGRYQEVLKKIDNELEIFPVSCPDLAYIIENRMENKYNKLNFYVEKLISNKVDTIILGCTHYSLIKNNILNYNINIVDANLETAKYISKFINNSENNKLEIYISSKNNQFVYNASKILEEDLSKRINFVKIIDNKTTNYISKFVNSSTNDKLYNKILEKDL